MERPYVLGVDLDGVCGDYTDAFRTVVAEELGCGLDDLPLERSWDFTEWGLDSEEFERLHHHAVTKRRILRWMPVIDSAADTLWRLSDAGVWIRIITHRLYVNWSHATAISDTVEWLDRVRIPYRDICFMGDKPEVGADLYIDDGPHNIEALRDTGNRVIIFDTPYNRHVVGTRALHGKSASKLSFVTPPRGVTNSRCPSLAWNISQAAYHAVDRDVDKIGKRTKNRPNAGGSRGIAFQRRLADPPSRRRTRKLSDSAVPRKQRLRPRSCRLSPEGFVGWPQRPAVRWRPPLWRSHAPVPVPSRLAPPGL